MASLPSEFGIGDFGPMAMAWADRLADAGQSWWQILPIAPSGGGNSPYEPLSSFALDELFVSPVWLFEDGLLTRRQLEGGALPAGRINYDRVRKVKRRLLESALRAFSRTKPADLDSGFQQFVVSDGYWLEDYALFQALRGRHGPELARWPADLRLRKPAALRREVRQLQSRVAYHRFAQFLAHRQLARLVDHARKRGIGLIGDIPFFAAQRSADMWSHPELFLLDEAGRPTFLSGVPPDYFSADGQFWGTPLYDWKVHRATDFAWWTERIEAQLRWVELVRLDHFRGFAAAWHVPAGAKTARVGEWRATPGHELLTAVRKHLDRLPIIAEDLGLITADVLELRDAFGLPGMQVLQFMVDDPQAAAEFRNSPSMNRVVYTGTHDNDTTRGWFKTLALRRKAVTRKTLHAPKLRTADTAWSLMECAWICDAILAIAPVQDILNLGSEARTNLPGEARHNWEWRMTREQLDDPAFERLAVLTSKTRRSGK